MPTQEQKREYSRRYAQSKKGKATRKRVNQSEAGKRANVKWQEKTEYNRRFYQENKHLWLRTRLKKYGLTEDQYFHLIEQQNGKCPVCGDDLVIQPEKGKRSCHIDHCHNSEKVRGLLCHHCNTALGLLKEDINIMKRMINYIEGVHD